MITPSQTALYKKAGVKALCLYYSCVPFDAFRTLIPQLDDEFAFNPLNYTYKGDSITIMPTYSQSDIMDAGTLRRLVTDLHAKQAAGEINHDVFVFINIDADSFLWEPLAVPKLLQKQPNLGGLGGLISETADLDFIRFDTVGGYLATHAPLKDVFFGQDVADCNFTSYASWAEKPFNRQIWTRLERARAIAAVNGVDATSPSFETRVRLLSTTHFGLASPVLNVTREAKALALSQEMLAQEKTHLVQSDTLLLKSAKKQKLFCAQLALAKGFCHDISALSAQADSLLHFTASPMQWHDDGSVKAIYFICLLSDAKKECAVDFSVSEKNHAAHKSKKKPNISVAVDEKSGFPVIMQDGNALARTESFIGYNSKQFLFQKPTCSFPLLGGDGQCMRFEGEIHLPNEQASGHYRFDFITSPCTNSLFLNTEVQYPYTNEKDQISSQASNLGRFTDKKWQEVSPLGFTLALDYAALIAKRNFMNDISSYKLADFWTAFPENECMDSFNHQLTGGLLCVSDSQKGLAIAHDRSVLGSMAHCPMRLRTKNGKRILSLNPFGAYYGKQRHYPTRGNGCVVDLYSATMPQAQSLAPSYNGACEQSIQALSSICGEIHCDIKDELLAVSDSAVAVGGTAVTAYTQDNAHPCNAAYASAHKKHLKSVSSCGNAEANLLVIGVRFILNMHRAKKQAKKTFKQFL
ncbi:MAG: hypothetical protein GXZ14_07935 [Ruminococcaceae bacterium]|nr:hypothetical protein [Oscillospiraceae bacterium]